MIDVALESAGILVFGFASAPLLVRCWPLLSLSAVVVASHLVSSSACPFGSLLGLLVSIAGCLPGHCG